MEFCRDLLAGEFVDAEQISAKVRNLEEVAPGSPTVASSRCWAEANSERPRSFGSAPDTVRRMRTRPCARSRVGFTIARTRRSCSRRGGRSGTTTKAAVRASSTRRDRTLWVVLFEMVTGTLPFREDSPLATARARLDREVPSLDRFGDSSGRDVVLALEGRVIRDRETRFSLPAERDVFVGREGELVSLVRSLSPSGDQLGRPPSARLLTILGPGGMGKFTMSRPSRSSKCWSSSPRGKCPRKPGKSYGGDGQSGRSPCTLRRCPCYPPLTGRLAKRGYDDAECVEIAGGADPLTRDLLGGHVLRRSDQAHDRRLRGYGVCRLGSSQPAENRVRCRTDGSRITTVDFMPLAVARRTRLDCDGETEVCYDRSIAAHLGNEHA